MRGATLLGLLCCEAVSCAAPTRTKVARPMPSSPEPASGTPDEAAHPASDMQNATPPSIRLVAVTDAPDFALRPRMEGEDQVVVPLPPDRSHLVRVEVGMLVTRRDTGEIMDQQTQIFSWKTRGAAMRFYLPALPGGDYVAKLRVTSTAMTSSGERDQAPDESQVSLRLKGQAHSLRSRELQYHFELQHAPGDTPALIQDEAAVRDAAITGLKTILHNNEVIKVTLDCWASSDGDARVNLTISSKRCAWVRKNILQGALARGTSPPIIAESHGEHNPPVPEPAGITGKELEEIQKLNRVVILKIYTKD